MAGIQQNRIAAAMIYEPFLTAFINSKQVRVLFYPFEAIGPHFAMALILAPSTYAADRAEPIRRFLEATQEASRYVATHESLSTELVAEFGGFDPATIANVRHSERGVAISPADIQPIIDIAAKYKVIPKAFPASDIICTCALMKR
jgi:ABC-type nitrate/sulfonate/bicarbonate transport system substrate-binding protein